LKSVIIIGAGINGLMIALSMRCAGWSVVVMDKGAIPNPQSASYGRHRLIHPYTPGDPRKAVEAETALNRWEAIWQILERSYFVNTGVLSIEAPGQEIMSNVSIVSNCLPVVEKLTISEAQTMMPLLCGGAFESAYLFPRYGVLLADRILVDMVALLVKQGVLFLPHTPARSVDTAGGSVNDTAGTTRKADCVVVAAGTGTAEILASCAWDGVGHADFVAKRCYVLYAETPHRLLPNKGNMPAWVSLYDGDLWGVPPVSGMPLKIGCSAFTHTSMPFTPMKTDLCVADEMIRRYELRFPQFRHLKPTLLAHNHWTQGPSDSHIYQSGRGFLVSACSGAGFKFAPLIGEKVLNLIDKNQKYV
jgi:sarcosine oxidase